MPNRLANEKSLYLRQHANNPVDWWPWCEEAWAEARRRDVPVLVSIGYSSCHWCHVMARESFNNDFIASLMNRHFVCIKVDREERPDIDQLFMESVQMITGQGGWPLNAFCLPDGRPFFGGTYFPPEDRNLNLVPWPQLIMRIADHYRKAPEELEDNARSIFGNLHFSNAPLGGKEGGTLNNRDLITAAESLCSQYDVQNGGFGGAPKFPPAMSLNFLDTVRSSAAVEARPELAAALDTVLTGTLTAMARGGIYDQIGGGFARYSVDAHWEIPHFEKMLYDNALLIGTFLRGYLRFRDPLYLSVIEETIGWLDREMHATAVPAYYAALDAETDGKEGVYYLWNPAQVEEVLGQAEAKRFCEAYGITATGNFEKTGLSNPIWHGKGQALRDALAPLRTQLLASRARRTTPGRDNKILTGWNALLAVSLAEAGWWLGRDAWLQKARALVDWLWDTMAAQQPDGTVLLHAVYYEDGGARVDAFLDDYAALAEACFTVAGKVDALNAGAHALYIERGNALLHTLHARFADADAPGWFFTPADGTACHGHHPAADAHHCASEKAHCCGSDRHHNNDETTQCCGTESSEKAQCCGSDPASGSDSSEATQCCGSDPASGNSAHAPKEDCCGGHAAEEADDHHSGEGCCGGQGNSGGCGCSHEADEPEAVPFVAPAPGGTLLRKKYWLDNATPAGNSLALHAFGNQQALSEALAPQAGMHIAYTRPAYAALAARAPAAIAHALTALATQAIGCAVVKITPTADGAAENRPPADATVTPLREALRDHPWRSLHVLVETGEPSASQSGRTTPAAQPAPFATPAASATQPVTPAASAAQPAPSSAPTAAQPTAAAAAQAIAVYQLCVGTQCLPPETSAQAVAERL